MENVHQIKGLGTDHTPSFSSFTADYYMPVSYNKPSPCHTYVKKKTTKTNGCQLLLVSQPLTTKITVDLLPLLCHSKWEWRGRQSGPAGRTLQQVYSLEQQRYPEASRSFKARTDHTITALTVQKQENESTEVQTPTIRKDPCSTWPTLILFWRQLWGHCQATGQSTHVPLRLNLAWRAETGQLVSHPELCF